MGHIDGTRGSRKFNVKVRPFPGAKQRICFTNLCGYVILHVGTNDAMDYETSAQENTTGKRIH